MNRPGKPPGGAHSNHGRKLGFGLDRQLRPCRESMLGKSGFFSELRNQRYERFRRLGAVTALAFG